MFALKKPDFVTVAAGLFAITLQISLTVFASDTYAGLRISSADFLIPVMGLVIAASLLLRRSAWPAWLKPFDWRAPAAMTVVVIFAMINGYFVQGDVSTWAVANKFTGWFLLMAYFAAAAWFATNHRHFVQAFLQLFVAFALLTMAGEIVIQVLKGFGTEITRRDDSATIYGLMANRNGYAFLLMTTACLVTVTGFRKPGPLLCIFWVMMPSLVLFNASRAMYICIVALLIIFACIDWRKTGKYILPCIAVGTALIFVIFSGDQRAFFSNMPLRTTGALIEYTQTPHDPEVQETANSFGHRQRLDIIIGALELVKQYPLQGAGLGSALHHQREQTGDVIDVIDCTPLWILTEMGGIGLAVFLGSYILMALALWRRMKEDKENTLALSILLVMFCFGIFSLFHELLYTRFLWFLLGLALVRPRQDAQTI